MKKFIITSIAAAAISGLVLTTAYAFDNSRGSDSMMFAKNNCPYASQGQGSQAMNNNMNQQRFKNNYMNCPNGSQIQGNKGKGFGPKDGTGNQGQRPLDGSGYGQKINQK
ncbi:MAG: hypothetical protein H6680_07405 [Desulfobacteraceae bacterium]|nr:hypothetical protein [Desulfobacteraceae bacterium]